LHGRKLTVRFNLLLLSGFLPGKLFKMVNSTRLGAVLFVEGIVIGFHKPVLFIQCAALKNNRKNPYFV